MKYFLNLALLLFCYTSVSATTVQSLDNLIKELNSLTPLQRILRTTKHVDTLLANGNELHTVTQRIDSLVSYSNHIQDWETLGSLRFYNKIKRGLLPIASEEIVSVFNTAIDHYKKQNDDRYTGVAHFYLAKHYYEQKQYGEAFYHQQKALDLFNKVGVRNIIDISRYLHVMALNYYHFGYYEKVVQLMRVSITMPAFNENLEVQRYNTLGLAYQKLNKLDSAAFYFLRTNETARSMSNTTWQRISGGNLGSVYVNQGRYQEALPLLMQDYQYHQRNNEHPVMARNAAVDIAAIWQKLGRSDSTLYYLNESERLNMVHKQKELMWKEQRDERFYLTYYETFHSYYKGKNNSQMAYHYLDSLTSLRRTTDLLYNKMTEQIANDRLRIEKQIDALTLEEEEKKKISVGLLVIIGIVGALAGLIGMKYYRLSLNRMKENLLVEQERMEHQVEQERIEAQLAKANLELNEYMLRIQDKNKQVETLQSQIEELQIQSNPSCSELENLTSRLADTKLLTLDDWNDFRQRFNRAYEGELDKLKLEFGDLTSAEERLYALEKLNVSTNQMAWMLGISADSVRKTRYRLRKKMGMV